jgi:hypothetical protein
MWGRISAQHTGIPLNRILITGTKASGTALIKSGQNGREWEWMNERVWMKEMNLKDIEKRKLRSFLRWVQKPQVILEVFDKSLWRNRNVQCVEDKPTMCRHHCLVCSLQACINQKIRTNFQWMIYLKFNSAWVVMFYGPVWSKREDFGAYVSCNLLR